MRVSKATLSRLLAAASYQEYGDMYEQKFGQQITAYFPNSERFWQNYIIPITQRTENYPQNLSKAIHFRADIDAVIQDISITHYSMFLNLAYAHMHTQVKLLSFVEDVYVHLGSACDLAETFIEKIYLTLLKCRGEKTTTLEQLSREDFLKVAGEWYDKRYSTLYQHYFSKGKMPSIKIISRMDILREFLEKYLQRADLWQKYSEQSRIIREFRNVVVHDVQIARAWHVNGGDYFIPKPSLIQKYRSWREVFTGIQDQNQILRDFVSASRQTVEDTQALEATLNDIWTVIMEQLEEELYHPDRNQLRIMYNLELEN